jgi:hypothetical protein
MRCQLFIPGQPLFIPGRPVFMQVNGLFIRSLLTDQLNIAGLWLVR